MQPRKQTLRITELDQEIIKFCDTPKKPGEIYAKFREVDKFIQPRVSRLKRAGYLDVIDLEPNSVRCNWLYVKGKVEVAPKPKKYKPLGICVFGVWM